MPSLASHHDSCLSWLPRAIALAHPWPGSGYPTLSPILARVAASEKGGSQLGGPSGLVTAGIMQWPTQPPPMEQVQSQTWGWQPFGETESAIHCTCQRSEKDGLCTVSLLPALAVSLHRWSQSQHRLLAYSLSAVRLLVVKDMLPRGCTPQACT